MDRMPHTYSVRKVPEAQIASLEKRASCAKAKVVWANNAKPRATVAPRLISSILREKRCLFVRLLLTSAQDNATRMEPAPTASTTQVHDVLQEARQELSSLVGEGRVHWGTDARTAHASDETEDLVFLPDVVMEPETTTEVSAIVAWAYKHGVPVTAGGARTGLSGGALPVQGGIALSMRRMNKILAIDTVNHQAIVEPGVITEVLSNAAAEHGLMYAVDPASRGTCTIGGNLAENSGGPRAVKYGVTKDWVLNLEVVLADGTVMETGANTLKNSTGYNLTQLMVGSEGTLGIITRATLKLLPLPRHQALMLVPFESASRHVRPWRPFFKRVPCPVPLNSWSAMPFCWHRPSRRRTNPRLAPRTRRTCSSKWTASHQRS